MPKVNRYSTQHIVDTDIEEVVSALRSDWLTQGPAVEALEASIEDIIGSGVKAVAVSSATAALHLAYHACGLNNGDVVITSPITFAATANAAIYCGR